MKSLKIISVAVLLLISASTMAELPDPSRKISLQFEDVPITTVLNMIAQQNNLNLVLSGDIVGSISVRLDNVSLGDAMDAILTSNGYNYYMSGNIVVVKPLEMNAIGETTARIFELNYISPGAVVNAVTDMLSTKGKIKIVENPKISGGNEIVPSASKLVLVDLPHIVDKVAAFIKKMDVKDVQVQIKVRMIETNLDDTKRIGFNWPASLNAKLGGITASSTSSTSETESFAEYDLTNGKWAWGTLSVNELSLVLDYLDSRGNSKLISDPSITALNHHEAEIKVTTVVPIQTINRFSEGGSVQDIVTFQDEEIGITLKVTPHVTEDNQIILDVAPTIAEIIGYSGTEGNQKPITAARAVRTKVTVKDNETAVLGGLLKEQSIEKEDRLFFLGSIPILGNLFRHKSTETNTTDLTILITPTIMKE